MLSIVYMALSNQDWDILQSVADIVLKSLKQENVKDFDKEQEGRESSWPDYRRAVLSAAQPVKENHGLGR